MTKKTNVMLMGLFLVLYEALANNGSFYQQEERLRAKILTKYNKKIRPSSQVICTIRLGIQHINHLDAPTHTFSITAHMDLHWYDDRLKWNPRNFGNITHIYPLKSHLWTPEIILENSVKNPRAFMHDDISIKASSKGRVTWEPSGVAETQCEVDLTYYPFDEQVCMVEVNTWDYGKEQIRLIPNQDDFYLGALLPSVEWDVVDHWSVAKEFHDGETTIDQIDFFLKIKRNYDHFVMTVLLPVVFVSLICPLGFFLPFEGGKKANYSLTILLTYTFMPNLIRMPSTSGKNCILGSYMTAMLMICALTTLLNVLCMFLYFRAQTRVPLWVQALFRRSFIPLVCWEKKNFRATSRTQLVIYRNSTDSNNTCRRQMPTHYPERFCQNEQKNGNAAQHNDRGMEQQAWRLDRVIIHPSKPRQENKNGENESEQRNNSHKHRDNFYENRDIRHDHIDDVVIKPDQKYNSHKNKFFLYKNGDIRRDNKHIGFDDSEALHINRDIRYYNKDITLDDGDISNDDRESLHNDSDIRFDQSGSLQNTRDIRHEDSESIHNDRYIRFDHRESQHNNRDIRFDRESLLSYKDIKHDSEVLHNNSDTRYNDRYKRQDNRHEQSNKGLKDSEGRCEYKNPNMEEEVKWITSPRILYHLDHTKRHESFNGNNNGKHQESLSSLSSHKPPFKSWSLGNLVSKKLFANLLQNDQQFGQYAENAIGTPIDTELSCKSSKVSNTPVHSTTTKDDVNSIDDDELSWRDLAYILDSFFKRIMPIIVVLYTIAMVTILVISGTTNTGRKATKNE